jgi:isopenicillin-N epimerase
MHTRRRFLQQVVRGGAATAVGLAALRDDALARVREAAAAAASQTPAQVAQDEDFWREIQQAFTLDRTITNLNNGGVCPSPRVVHEAFKRYLDISNQAPVYHMWQILEPNIETVRRRLAADFGCNPEEQVGTTAREAAECRVLRAPRQREHGRAGHGGDRGR